MKRTFSPPRVRRDGADFVATIALGACCEITALGQTEEEAIRNVRTLVNAFERGGHPRARREAERIVARGAGA